MQSVEPPKNRAQFDPLLYHAHHMQHMEDFPFWLNLANRYGDPILELGCGSGRLLLPLAEAGYQVYGLDHHSGMLSLLKDRLGENLRQHTHLCLADLTAFHFGIRFPLILLPCNTFSTLNSTQRKANLARVKEHLQPSGRYAFSLPNPTALESISPEGDPETEDFFLHPIDGEPVQVSSSWSRSKTHFTVYWYYDHLLSDGTIERSTVEVGHELINTQTYLAEIGAAGLEIVEIYGDYDGTAYHDDAPYLILTLTV